ncbi:zf-DHHC-domain-containing protein, partial [Jaminaea rosea]
IIATITLISFLAYSSQFFILIPYWLSTPGVSLTTMALYLVPFNIGVAFIFYNYYLVVFTSPGDVPPAWEPDWDSLGGVEVKASTGSPRYCKVCRSYKPPRAHHCRVCKRCVLRMDHHCPWVANCVGYANYGHFLRFLYSVDITMSMHVGLLALRVADWWSPYVHWREPSTAAMVVMVLNFAQGIPVLLMVGIFSLYHTYALCINTTTIESWEKDKVATLVRRGKIEEVKYPYDLGLKRNIQAVLGRRIIYWCWPGQGPLGNGLDYTLAEGHG